MSDLMTSIGSHVSAIHRPDGVTTLTCPTPLGPESPYEITLDAHEGFPVVSQIALLLRRLDNSPLIDML
jgi:hypothetical protein